MNWRGKKDLSIMAVTTVNRIKWGRVYIGIMIGEYLNLALIGNLLINNAELASTCRNDSIIAFH
jgi:hypothetical protein